MTSQEQKGGMGSTNVQVGQINVGMTYKDVKEIALDIYHENAATLKGEALKIAEARVEQLAEELASRLAASPEDKLAGFAQPEKQVAILDAQKAYAVSGDSNLRSMLVETIVRMSAEPERSLRGVALAEAIKVMAVLQPHHITTLAICFLMRRVSYNNQTALNISLLVQGALGQDFAGFPVTEGDFLHLDFSRCANVEIGEVKIGQLLCIHQGLPRESPPDKQQSAISEFSTTPAGKFIADQWDNTSLKNLTLTSVGIAIGHTYVSKHVAFPDLSVWL